MKTKIKNFLENNYLLFLDLYLISVFLKSSTLIIDYPVLYTVEKVIRVIAFIFMIMRCIVVLPEILTKIKNIKWKESNLRKKILIVSIILLFIAIIINTIKIKSIRLMSICLVVISAYNVDLRKILKNILAIQLIMTCGIIMCSILEITQDYTVSRLNESVVRHSMGFSYVTNLSQMVFFISLIYMYLKSFKVKISDILILQILNIYTYYLTDSKTEILAFEILLIICILVRNKYIKKLIPICSKIITKLYILVPILSLTLVLLYPLGGGMKTINNALSGRLSVQCKVISGGNIKLFGTNTKMVGYGLEDALNHNVNKEYNYIDNEYIQILVVNGVIITLALIIILYFLVIELDDRKRYRDVFFIYTYLLFGLINPRIIELMYSPVLFYIIPFLLSEKEKNI